MAIVPILGPDCSESEAGYIGGKAAQLRRLHHTPLAIPRWVCVSRQVFENSLQSIKNELQTLWHAWQNKEIQAADLSWQLQSLSDTLIWPAACDLQLALTQAGFGSDIRFAVRSSAQGEDAEHHSFAGLFQSHLNIQAADIVDSIVAIWKQTLSLAVFEYLRYHQLSLDELSMAILIQEMIPADVSGVYFCASPDGNLNQQVIVAAYGLGIGVVDGSVAVDSWTRDRFEDFNAEGQVIWHADIHIKPNAYSISDTGIETRSIDAALQASPCLNTQQLNQLLEAGHLISQQMGAYQDIEWSFKGGQLWILQSRGISTLPSGPYLLFDNSNIVESYPDIVLPLSASLIQRGYQQNLHQTLLQIGFEDQDLAHLDNALRDMIAPIQGRLYYHMSHWHCILSLLPGIRQLAWKSFAHLIQHSQILDNPHHEYLAKNQDSNLTTLKIFKIYLRLLWKIWRLPQLLKQHQEEFQLLYQEFKQLPVQNMRIEALIQSYDDYFNRFLKLFYSLLLNDLWLGICSQGLKKLLPESLQEQKQQVYMQLISHAGELESYHALRHLYLLAKELKQLPELCQFISENAESSWYYLSESQELKEKHFLSKINAYLIDYGMRGPDELKLETVSMQDQPWQLLLRVYYLSQDPTRQDLNFLQMNPSHAQDLLADLGLLRRLACRVLIRQIHLALQRREIGRLNRTRKLAAVRKLFTELAQKLCKAGRLESPEDIYYLKQSDLIESLSQKRELAELAQTRRQEYQQYAQFKPKSRLLLAQDPAQQVIAQHRICEFNGSHLSGMACSSGEVTGPVVCITHARADLDVRGKILVCAATDPGWVLLMSQALGLIVEQGNLLSHAAIMARELNLPTLVGVKDALALLQDGDIVFLNATQGWLEILDQKDASDAKKS